MEIHQPAAFSNRVCNALKATPQSLDLRAHSPFFYAFAHKYLAWTEREDLLDIVVDTFRARVAKVFDQAQSPGTGTGGSGSGSGPGGGGGSVAPEDIEFLQGLDDLERSRTSSLPFPSLLFLDRLVRIVL